MSVRPMELIKQSVDVILCVCACMHLCVSVCVCVHHGGGKTICQCFDSHVTRRGSVSREPGDENS